MALTEFGKAVRKARIDIGQTLASMAAAIGTTPAFLSAMETGSRKVSPKWVGKIDAFLKENGVEIEDIHVLAKADNEVVPTKGLSYQQRLLVAGFAKSQLSHEDLRHFATLLEEIQSRQEG